MVGSVTSLDLLAPFHPSHAADETEEQLKSIFVELFNAVFADKINDIHHYGMPTFGGSGVIERLTKQDGLAVLRRENANDLIMRVIYANWKSLASKRGLAFLEFVLQMLWLDKWTIHRLWHSYDVRDQYPEYASITKEDDSFLTSRIMILLTGDVDIGEVWELIPTFSRLVPANIVPLVAIDSDLGGIDYYAAMVATTFSIGAYQYHD